MKIRVPVKFEGTVVVDVPSHLSIADGKLLAEKVAVCKVLATVENPDVPEDDTLAEYEDECSEEALPTAVEDWLAARTEGVSGDWEGFQGTIKK